MANLRVTSRRYMVYSARKLFYTGTISRDRAKFFRSFPFVTVYHPCARGYGTFNVPPRRKTMCFMHRPAHYRLNVPGENLSPGREGNFDARRTEQKGCVTFIT